ncbi:YopX family protein [Lactiplantibacillus plantarum]|uniref:YopX family protein n=1 Tax=Lactiplantibacillus plantarum TaxID=1590 RepID=UPI0007C76F60|nr:YopX family protein [Lactiplantibacillus plantarum]
MIKFRAWDKQNEIYLYNVQDAYDTLGGFVKYDDGKDAAYDESCFGDFLDNERYDTEQFTGLKDENGKGIYEGDILYFGSVWCVGDEYDPREEEHTGFVEYRPDYASYVVNCNGRIYPLEELTSFDGYSVQGNVHDNPELLEADK